jgi:acetyl esterase/lipase
VRFFAVSDAQRISYGGHPAQFGELHLPQRVEHVGTVAVVHGGFWRARYDLDYGRPLAADLAAHGFVAWNIEYRRVGNGGGWPTTADDVAAAIDHLAVLDIDTSAVVAVGHSAGGQLAVWAAGRTDPRVPLIAAVSQAGVLDLVAAHDARLSSDAVAAFLGGGPEDVPDHYRAADPLAAAPIDVPVLCVHARADDNVPIAQSEAYVARGGQTVLREVPGDHFTVIDPPDPSWRLVRDALPDLLAGHLPN